MWWSWGGAECWRAAWRADKHAASAARHRACRGVPGQAQAMQPQRGMGSSTAWAAGWVAARVLATCGSRRMRGCRTAWTAAEEGRAVGQERRAAAGGTRRTAAQQHCQLRPQRQPGSFSARLAAAAAVIQLGSPAVPICASPASHPSAAAARAAHPSARLACQPAHSPAPSFRPVTAGCQAAGRG